MRSLSRKVVARVDLVLDQPTTVGALSNYLAELDDDLVITFDDEDPDILVFTDPE
jgi:hypothetical protein